MTENQTYQVLTYIEFMFPNNMYNTGWNQHPRWNMKRKRKKKSMRMGDGCKFVSVDMFRQVTSRPLSS